MRVVLSEECAGCGRLPTRIIEHLIEVRGGHHYEIALPPLIVVIPLCDEGGCYWSARDQFELLSEE